MWVKICANTTAADARMAADAGADAVGFVFAPSRRRVTSVEVAGMGLGEMVSGTGRPVARVGVFVSGDAGEIVRAAREAGLTGVQLHGIPDEVSGDEGAMARLAAAVRGMAPELRVVPVLHWVVTGAGDAAEKSGTEMAAGLRALRAAGFRRVLLDAKVGAELGGTGVAFDWARAAAALAEAREGMELILAGGLRPETVGEAVRVLRPWGVDVASGVEVEPGRKCPERVREFLRAARV